MTLVQCSVHFAPPGPDVRTNGYCLYADLRQMTISRHISFQLSTICKTALTLDQQRTPTIVTHSTSIAIRLLAWTREYG